MLIPKLKAFVNIFFSAPLQRFVRQHHSPLPEVPYGVHVGTRLRDVTNEIDVF
jgi:hypothetical protein